MDELRETIARAGFDAFWAEGTDYDAIEQAMWAQVADAVLAVIRDEVVLIDCDDAAHIYDVLMATGKTKTARIVFDAMTSKP